jgi:hypothetical protein
MKRAVLAVIIVVAALLAACWLMRKRPSAVSSQLSASDLGTRGGGGRATRPAPPLRLPNATVVEEKSAAGGFGGRVLSTADGQPIAHASLTFLYAGAALSADSDEAGRFVVKAPPGAYELASATAKGFTPFEPQLGHSPVIVQARAGVRIDDVTVYLQPALEIDVLVVGEHDKPLAGAEVRAFDDRSGPADAKVATTDAKGHATVAAQGWDVVEARHAGYVSARVPIGFAAQTSGQLTVRLVPGADRPRLAISGRVVDGNGLPVDGALVEAYAPPSQAGNEAPGAQTLSGDDGRFTLAALVDAEYSVRATTRTQGSALVRGVHGGAHDVELRLGAASAVLHGTVRDGSGKVLTAFTVVARLREGIFGQGAEERATVIDPEGRYALPLPAGKYAVSAAARGYARSHDETVEIGDEGAEHDFTLARGSRIFGRVVERGSGKALSGANVSFEGHAINDDIGLSTDAVTAADGSFSLDGLPAGRQSLNVQAAGHNGRILGALEVPTDGALGPLTIDLAPTKPGEEPTTEFVGIGAGIAARPEGMIIISVTPSGGAADAGLVVGDTILTIDGQSAEELGFIGSIQLIRGPEDSIVVLVVKRKDGSVQTIPVRRKRVTF